MGFKFSAKQEEEEERKEEIKILPSPVKRHLGFQSFRMHRSASVHAVIPIDEEEKAVDDAVLKVDGRDLTMSDLLHVRTIQRAWRLRQKSRLRAARARADSRSPRGVGASISADSDCADLQSAAVVSFVPVDQGGAGGEIEEGIPATDEVGIEGGDGVASRREVSASPPVMVLSSPMIGRSRSDEDPEVKAAFQSRDKLPKIRFEKRS